MYRWGVVVAFARVGRREGHGLKGDGSRPGAVPLASAWQSRFRPYLSASATAG